MSKSFDDFDKTITDPAFKEFIARRSETISEELIQKYGWQVVMFGRILTIAVTNAQLFEEESPLAARVLDTIGEQLCMVLERTDTSDGPILDKVVQVAREIAAIGQKLYGEWIVKQRKDSSAVSEADVQSETETVITKMMMGGRWPDEKLH